MEKETDETLGVTFTADVFDGIRICSNNCDFCFVYQNRRRMRKSVYVKDDDYRLSFLHGDFITLTNLTEQCWERIFRLQPEPALRQHPRHRPGGARGDAAQPGRRAADRSTWTVSSTTASRSTARSSSRPGINDGPILDRTVEEMAALHARGCLTLAIVPVGLTTQRVNLPVLADVTGTRRAR